MERSELHSIAGEHYGMMKEYARDSFNGFDHYSIHQFRVEYKKLRAFLRMISEDNNHYHLIQMSKDLKHTYKITGTIRDLQLLSTDVLQLLNGHKARTNSCLKAIRRKIQRQQRKLKDMLAGKPIKKSRKKTDRILPDTFSFQNYIRYIAGCQNSTKSILIRSDFNDEDLHALRKILKDLFNNSGLFTNEKNEQTQNNGNDAVMTNPMLEKLLVELGIIQDQCTSLALLGKPFLHKWSKKNRKQAAEMKHVIVQRKKRVRQTVLEKLSSFNEPFSVRLLNENDQLHDSPVVRELPHDRFSDVNI
ncbi:CHAD domain-containing protein [Pollutibacter soli]|uniref:CHAD domain-containing protein n=1 Tax=Pollutibacter soli TaxID=3034157 RepID=UPI00301343FB